MPPEKQLVKVFKLGLGALETLLLAELQKRAGGTVSDHIRLAIVDYARRHPALEGVDFSPRINSSEVVHRPEDRVELRRNLQRFVESRRRGQDADKDPDDLPSFGPSLHPLACPVGRLDDDH